MFSLFFYYFCEIIDKLFKHYHTMKKLALFLLAAALVALPSCKNQNKQAAEQPKQELSQQDKYLVEELQANLESLAESAKQLKPMPAAKIVDGSVKLSTQEKLVKPDYLLDPACANDLVTLSQKYRAIGMLYSDRTIAELYEMSITDYKAALSKLVTEVNDPAFQSVDLTKFKNKELPFDQMVSTVYDKEVEAGRLPYFWDLTAAAFVEQLYFATRNIDKFLTMFDDETASNITYNFILVHENVSRLVKYYPEMASLNEILEPLYVINAINKKQLRDQLFELKGSIETVRASLLK